MNDPTSSAPNSAASVHANTKRDSKNSFQNSLGGQDSNQSMQNSEIVSTRTPIKPRLRISLDKMMADWQNHRKSVTQFDKRKFKDMTPSPDKHKCNKINGNTLDHIV